MSPRRAFTILAALALVGACLLTATAEATDFVVTDPGDAGPDTLRQAVLDASADNSGPHTIDIQVSAPIVLTSGQLAYNNLTGQDLTIEGNGATVEQTMADSRVLFSQGTGALSVNDLTMTGGDGSNPGGAIKATGPVTVTASRIVGNEGGTGGGISGDATVTAINSTIADNDALGGGGGGIEAATGATLLNTTVSGNGATAGGGGVASTGPITSTNSTVSGNGADAGAGGLGGGVGGVTLIYSTVVENVATLGANASLAATGTLTSFGSVIASPQGGGTNCVDLLGTTSNGFNFSDDTSCGFTGTGDQQDGDPGLGPLDDNGGTTLTHLPQPASPLIDVIPTDACQADGASGIADDQIGTARPQATGCDIGSVEVPAQEAPPPASGPVAATPAFTG